MLCYNGDMPIRVLPVEIASQIAAGEVVERPASVVKELLENALDAGASTISVKVGSAGRRLIEVADDGEGIPLDELPLAVKRHATSKISEVADLFKISSLGFRGEALASIGSVATLTLTSRAQGAEAGGRLTVKGGQADSVHQVGSPHGTVVRVEDLFYNVPARLKFLKSDVTERRRIDELVTRYALAYPHVRFQLAQEGKVSLHTSGNGNRREVLASLYGVDIARQMLEVIAEFEDIQLGGFISPISITRSNRKEIAFFLNGRWIQDPALTTALTQAYHTFLMVGRYPMASLFLEMPAEKVDVNVHPTKAEVRFREREAVFSAVQRAVRRALLVHTPVPEIASQATWSTAGWGNVLPEEGAQLTGSSLGVEVPDRFDQSGALPARWGQAQQKIPGQKVPILRLVGQIAQAYLVAEGPDGLYLIDQHAAHERVLFEQLMAQRSEEVISQRLLEPQSITISPAESRLLEDQIPVLEKLGFDVEPFGMNTYLVRAIPAILARTDPAEALRVLVGEFEEDETPLQAEIETRIIARVCKRAAVKAGQSLSAEEQVALLRDLEACEAPRTCPHGRPTMIHLSVDLLERQFGRKGAM